MAANPFEETQSGASANPFAETQSQEKKPKSPGIARKSGDLAAGFVSGALGATKALTDVTGAGNDASNFLDSATKDVDSLLSPQAQADKREQGAIMQGAEGKGAYEGIKAGFKAFGVAPAQTMMSGFGSVVPVAAATLATGGGAVPALAAGAATGMAMGAGTVKGAIYDDIKQRSLESGMTPEAAEAAATQAQSYGAGNTDQIAIGAGLGALDAATGVTPIVANLARKAVGREAVKVLTTNTGHGILRRTATGALEEIPLEAAQGGQEQLAANLAAQRAGYQVGTWDNVASNATLEGLASAGPGAAFGAMSGKQPATAPPAETPAEATAEDAAALQLGFNPGAGTATVFPDGSVVLNSESSNGAKTVRDMQRENRLANVGRENLAPVNPAEPDAASFASILDTDQVYEGWSNVRDGTDRSIMRGQMEYVASNYGGIATEENRDALNQELSAQFKWFKAAPLEQRNAALDSLIANPAPAKPSVAMGLDPAAGPMSAAAALAVDTGVNKPTMGESLTGTDSATQLQRAARGNNPLQEAMRAKQSEADAAIPLDAATEADRRAYEDAFDRPAPPEYMGLPSDARKAILYGNKEVNDGGKQFSGTQDGDIFNGMSTPFKTRFAAAKRARMMGDGWTIAPVPDGFVARWKGPTNVSNTGDVPGLAAAADGGRSDQPGTGVGDGVEASGVAGPALDARGAGVAPVGGFVPQGTDARQDAVGAKGPISNPTLPTDPGGTTTPVIEDKKTKWLKAINDQNRLAGSTGIQLTVVDGKLTFMGDPRSSKQGQALNATFEEAQKAGATIPEIIASIQSLQKTATQPGQTNAASTQAAPEAPAISSATPGLPAAGANADAQVDGENPATQLQGATTDAATPANPGTQTSPAPSAQGAPKAGTAVANPSAPGAVARKAPPNSVIKDVRDFDGNKLADIVVPHDGTKEGVLKAAIEANRQMNERFGHAATHAGSRTGATDENGNPAWVVSPNMAQVARYGTREADYIFGDLSAAPSNDPEPADDIKAITARQIPDMTDAELAQMQAHYGPDHKRAAKIAKEINRRALAAKLKPKPPAATPAIPEGVTREPQADQTQQAEAQPPPEPAAEPAALHDSVKKASHEAAKKLWENPEFAKRPDATIYAAGWTTGYDGKPMAGLLAKSSAFIEGHADGVKAAAPVQVTKKVDPKQARIAARELELSLFNALSADVSMVGKTLDEITAAINDRASADTGAPTGDRQATLAKSIHKTLVANAKELAKLANRDPTVYKAAVDSAITSAKVDGVDASARFQAGWAHALAGKTKSTLVGDMLADQIKGYEGAREWMKTPAGKAWFDGVPVAKLKNTGVDLRRHWELMKAEMKANESDAKKAWAQIERATARADLFAPFLTEQSLPGFAKYVTEFRSNVMPFKKWLDERATAWWGDKSYRGRYGNKSDKSDIEYMLEGSRGPTTLVKEDRQKFKDDESYRISVLQDFASQYLAKVKDLTAFLDGATNVSEAAKAFDLAYVKPELIDQKDGRIYNVLNEAGEQVRTSYRSSGIGGVWEGNSNPSFQSFRTASPWTETLIEKEATLELPKRADQMVPPKLDRVTREGMTDQRNGANVSPEEAKALFGFADVGFGEYVASKDDQDHLNYGHDAFMDLANHFGTSPKNIGFGGQLHFTIGALGHGKFSAHFSPNHPGPKGPVQVINLTNTKGDGAVYHEWIHALDHFMGGEWRRSGQVREKLLAILKYSLMSPESVDKVAKRFLVGGAYWTNDKRGDKVLAAIRGIRHYSTTAEGNTAFKFNADKLGKDYWGNNEELIARAAEAWAVDTLKGTNTYLVNQAWAGDGKVTQASGFRGTPYPTGGERITFAKAFTALAKATKWVDGKPSVTLADFQAALPPEFTAAKERLEFLSKTENMQAFYEELLVTEGVKKDERDARLKAIEEEKRLERERATAAEKEAMDKLAADKLAELEPAIVDGPAPSEAMGPLSDAEIEAIFDQAAAQVRERDQEKPEVAPPGAEASESTATNKPTGVFAQWPQADLEELLAKANNADMIAISGGEPIWNVPDIHELGRMGTTTFLGDGMFETKGTDSAGKPWSMMWDGGGAMKRTAGGKAWTNVGLSGNTPYPSGVRRAIEAAIDAKAAERRDAAAKVPAALPPALAAQAAAKSPKVDATPVAEDPTATALIAKAAKLGVSGIDDALKGLSALFGGPGRLNSFPGGFDADTYAKAKPFFESSLKKFQESGKSLLDLFDMLIEALGMGIKPYAVQFAKDQKLQANLAADQSPSIKIAEKVQQRLAMGHSFDWRVLFGWADEAFGGTQGEGKYTPKDAYDALEAGVNRYLMADQGRSFKPNTDREGALLTIAALERVTALLPTQTKRTAEQDEFQQFSTVPALAFAANWVANITAGDLMLEPSAGIGGLAVFAKNAGAKLVLNELSARRAALLQSAFPASKVMTENAEQINNTLPDELAPTVVVMNPPFSASAGRMEGVKNTMVGALHVEQALKRMVPGARLVAIVGEGMGMDRPAFAAWWKKISAEYDVRAVIPMDGAGYAKYGTTFDNAILVIDKVKPVAGRKVVTTKAMTYTELVGLLSEIRNDRPVVQRPASDREGIERDAAESALGEPASQGGSGDPAGQPDGGESAGLGGGKPLHEQTGRGGSTGGGRSSGGKKPGSGVRQPDGRDGRHDGGDKPGGSVDEAGKEPAGNSGVSITGNEVRAGELTDSVFEGYTPQRLQIEGAKPHPGPLVQSSAMASVLPPAATYTPNLPKSAIAKGLLSLAQLESVVYAGQSHEQELELKSTPDTLKTMKLDKAGVLKDAAYRRGFFIGDGTGVGKGREISGILLDNLRNGRKKHVWISEKQGLINDAARDFAGVQDGVSAGDILKSGQLFNLSKRTDAGTWKVNADSGILYTTYSTLRSAQKFGNFDKGDEVELTDGRSGTLVKVSEKNQKISVLLEGDSKPTSVAFADVDSIDGDAQWSTTLGKKAPAGFKPRSRLDQVVEWLGPDFDGVIAFDEAHNAGNAVGQKGKMGTTEASAQAEAVVELQNRLPRARIVYVSATGATEVSNFAFANRLGLWGPGTAFASLSNFIAEMVSGGLATMELVARDMKQMGAYIARSLSFDGVSYSRLEHQLSDMQNDQYNRMAEAWQVTLRSMTAAMAVTGATGPNGEKKNNRAKGNLKSAYWGAQQRFFNQIITAMQMPTVLDSIDADLKAGHAIVLQLVNTNESSQDKALGEKKEKGDTNLEDLDMTPRQMLMQMVLGSYPVAQYEDFIDTSSGTPKKGSRKALDADGNEIQNREAVAMRDALLKDLEQIKVPSGPLEILINHFGPEITAEITGRKQRVVDGRWNKTHKGGGTAPTFIQKRGAAAARSDADAFMADKKRILIFSDAGGTGFSFHADKTQSNQRQRKHYLIQPGWRANKAVQGLGRTHRTNQKSAPEYVLVATDIPAHKRFLSSIARRLDQLGALTKGQRDTSSGGLFTEKDNLESKYAKQAARQLILDIQRGQVEGVTFKEFMHQMGIEDIINPQTNQIADDKFPEPSQFLNRLLSLTIPMQNKVFAAFISRMEEKIDVAAQRGELDTGMQTIRSIETNILNEEVIYTDPRTGAETSYIELDAKQPNRFYTFPSEKTQGAKIRWAMNKKSGRVWAIVKSGTITKRDGSVVDKYRALGTGGTQIKEGSDFPVDSWKEITEDEARVLWDAENQVRPKTYNEKIHLISGAMLPIWDRLKTDGAIQVARTQTSDGRRLLGRVINQKDVADIRKRMNIASPASKLTIPEVMARILKGDTAELANGWKLARARVSDDLRIEVDAGYLTPAAARELLALGAMHERIQWKDRYFIPTGNAGIPVLDGLFRNKPIVDLFDPNAAVPDDTAAMSRAHSARQFSPIARIQATKAVEATAKVLQHAMVNGPKVIVAFDMGDPVVPDAVRRADDKQRSGGAKGAPEGFYHKGTVYLMASKLNTPADVARVYAHEVLGHHGLRGLFGSALKPILQQIATMRKAQVDAKIKEYGLRGVQNLDRLTAAEEVLAEMAQTMPEIGFVQRAIAAIRTWLRANVPGLRMLELTDAEIIRSYILPARGWVTRGPDGNGPKDGLPVFSRGGKYNDGPDQRFSRPWYDRLVSLLPDSYRNDPHRREPLPAEGWDVQRTREVQGKVDALNRELRGPKDTKGYGPVNIDLLGNLQVDARDAAIGDVMRAIKALADELAYGVVVTGVKTDDIRMLRGAGFESEISLAAVAERLTGVREKTAENTASVRAPGTIMSYQPRGLPLALFSRSKTTDDAKAAVVTNVKTYAHKAGNRLADFRGLALGSMGRRQLVDVYGDILPLDRYNTLVQQMDADKNEAGAEADTLADTWGKLNATTKRPEEDRHVAEMMHDATLARIDPDKPLQPGDDPDVHQELARRFNALSAEGKAIYRQARTMYAEHFDKVKTAIRERIQRSEMTDGKKVALMEKMDAQFFGAVKGVYFPLQRFGQYTVLVRNAEGDIQSVNRAETLNEAEETRRILLQAFPAAKGFTVGKVLKAKEFNSANESAGRGFMKELFDVLDKQGVSEDVQDSINQLYLASLPDLSWAKHGIHRKGTPGFSQDARRAFAQNMFHGARYLAKIRYSDQLQTELEGMQEHVDSWTAVEDVDSVKAQQVVDEFAKRHELLMNPDSNPISTALTSLGFVFHLGLSPASALVNLTQTAMVAYPIMGAKWGFDKASSALLKASKEAAGNRNDISKILSGDEKRAYDQAVRSGVIDVTQAHDLAGISQGEDAKVTWKLRPVMRAASFLFHHAEKFNRQVTFVASYRLAKAAGAEHEVAYEQAVNATYGGHFDYSSSNRPRFMQGNVARVVLLFKQYAQNMIFTLGREAQVSITGTAAEKKVARRALAGLLTTHALAAGAFGLPLVGTLLALASMLGGDDDEPWDAKTALQNMLADSLGQKPAEVIAHGLSRLTPWDISGRVGLDKLLLPDIQEGLQGSSAVEAWMTSALGAVAGIAVNAGKGMAEISEGRLARGLEAMMPTALRGPLKAYRFATEGNIDKTGVAINDEVSPAGAAGQALGFSPSETRNAQEGRSAIYQADKAVMARRSHLLHQYGTATMAGDEQGRAEAREAIHRFNEKNPKVRINPMQMMQSVRNRQKRAREADEGVYLPKSRRGAVEAGAFAREE